MMNRNGRLSTLTVSFLLAICIIGVNASAQSIDYAKERAERATELTQPYGWFSLVALEWLKPGVTTVGSAADNSLILPSAPGHLMKLEQKDGKVTLLASDPSLTFAARPATTGTKGMEIGIDEQDSSALASGSLRMWAIERGGKRYLRVKDSNAPALKNFHGLNWYTPEKRYRVEARWIPYTSPHTLKVTNKLGQVTPVQVPGYVEFEMNGTKQTLVPMDASKDGLFFVFRDSTARTTTDGGGRFLSTDAPSAGMDKPGTVMIDFNEAVNPPCAYSPFATCPLASPENRLNVSIPAGEKRYED